MVDTGLHALGWTCGRAIAYLVGQQHILALRDRARQALGGRFDLRQFNNAVIDQGALPLELLSTQIAAWIGARQA